MPKITVTTDSDEVVEVFELTGHYDLTKPIARITLRTVVAEAITKAEAIETGQQSNA